MSMHEIGRRSLPDEEQLRSAASEGRIFVIRNRNDFLALTAEFYRRSEPHAGVLIITAGLPNNRPERLAYALKRWKKERGSHLAARNYYVDFLSLRPPP